MAALYLSLPPAVLHAARGAQGREASAPPPGEVLRQGFLSPLAVALATIARQGAESRWFSHTRSFRCHQTSKASKLPSPCSQLPVGAPSQLHSCLDERNASLLSSAGGRRPPPPPSLPLSTGIYVSLSTYSTFEPSLPAPTPIPLLLPLLVTLILLVLPLPPPPSSVSSLLHPLSLPYEYELVAAPP